MNTCTGQSLIFQVDGELEKVAGGREKSGATAVGCCWGGGGGTVEFRVRKMQKLFLTRLLMHFLSFLFLSLKVLLKASFLYLRHLTLNFIKVTAQHFQTFSNSHSVICFCIGQIEQTFCIFHTCTCTCKRYACCLFWDSKKLHSRKHKTARVT